MGGENKSAQYSLLCLDFSFVHCKQQRHGDAAADIPARPSSLVHRVGHSLTLRTCRAWSGCWEIYDEVSKHLFSQQGWLTLLLDVYLPGWSYLIQISDGVRRFRGHEEFKPVPAVCFKTRRESKCMPVTVLYSSNSWQQKNKRTDINSNYSEWKSAKWCWAR